MAGVLPARAPAFSSHRGHVGSWSARAGAAGIPLNILSYTRDRVTMDRAALVPGQIEVEWGPWSARWNATTRIYGDNAAIVSEGVYALTRRS